MLLEPDFIPKIGHMKAPPRKFVVEFKAGRRRSAMKPDTSIWGKTDLRALVREAESDAPHLFGPSNASKASEHVSEAQPAQAPDIEIEDSPKADSGQEAATSPIELQHIHLPADARGVAVDPAAPGQGQGTAQVRRGAPNRSNKANVKVHVASPRDERVAVVSEVPLEMSLDELDSLETENQRLRALLAKQLHQENLWLRQMLKRFDRA